uniref:Uncharacterized protein n=1 Tax=Bursaphelenchus xylophilus TaxID=6326 RepID=A0A1I7STX9_BURXY
MFMAKPSLTAEEGRADNNASKRAPTLQAGGRSGGRVDLARGDIRRTTKGFTFGHNTGSDCPFLERTKNKKSSISGRSFSFHIYLK